LSIIKERNKLDIDFIRKGGGRSREKNKERDWWRKLKRWN